MTFFFYFILAFLCFFCYNYSITQVRNITEHSVNSIYIAGNIRTFFSTQDNFKDTKCWCSSNSGTPFCSSGDSGSDGCPLIKKAKIIPEEMITLDSSGKIVSLENSFGGTFGIYNLDKSKSGDNKTFGLWFTGIPEEACISLLTHDWTVTGNILGIGAGSGSNDPNGIRAGLPCSGDSNNFCANDLPLDIDKVLTACHGSGINILIKFE